MIPDHLQKQTDKGWQSMNNLLDREMPREKQHPRMAVLWWRTALGIMTLLALVLWWWKSDEKTPSLQANSAQEDTRKGGETSVTALPHPDTYWGKSTPVHTSGIASHPEHLPAQPTHPHETSVPSATASEDNQVLTRSMALAPLYEVMPLSPGAEDEIVDWPLQQVYDALPTHFCLLESAAPTLLLPAAKGSPFVRKVVKKVPRHCAFTWKATMSIATEHFNAANSLSVGGVMDWKPRRGHWGLRSGLSYEHYRPSGFARPIAEVNADQYADATRNYAFLFSNSVYVPGTSEVLGLDVALPVVLMQRLRMPVLFFWQPAKWLRWYGGTSLSYTLRAHVLREGLAFDDKLVGARSQASMERVNTLATQELPRFNTQIQSGWGFHFGKRWEVEMNYRQSAKIQFRSLFEKRVEEGHTITRTPMFRRPNHHFFSVNVHYTLGSRKP